MKFKLLRYRDRAGSRVSACLPWPERSAQLLRHASGVRAPEGTIDAIAVRTHRVRSRPVASLALAPPLPLQYPHRQYSLTQLCYSRLRSTPYGVFFSTLTHARNRARLLPACPMWPSSPSQADAPEQGCSTRVEELLSHPYGHLDSPEHEGIVASRADERSKEVAVCGESVYPDS